MRQRAHCCVITVSRPWGPSMTNMSIPAASAAGGDFRIGPVFSRAWDIGLRNADKFVIVTAIASLPNLFAFLFGTPPLTSPGRVMLVNFSMLTLRLFLGTISQAVLLYGAFQDMRGKPVHLGEAIHKGLARFFPILGVAVLTSAGIALAGLLLLVPGVILAVRWAVALPVCVVEGLGPLASMGRSAVLTRGHRWKVFAILLLLVIIGPLVGSIAALVFRLHAAPLAAAFAYFAWTAIWGVLYYGVLIMVYHDLRATKEGVDVEQLVAVFD
jgi:hypothetical protein